MPLRYQVKDPDGGIVYETESLADVNRHWRVKLHDGCVVVDILHQAGLVNAPGDQLMIRQISNRMFDNFASELPVCCEYFDKNLQLHHQFLNELAEIVERWAVIAVTDTPI